MKDLNHLLTSNTTYYFTDSTYLIDSIVVSNLVNVWFIGHSTATTIFEGITAENVDDTISWAMRGIELDNSDYFVIKNIQIRWFRGYGLKADSYSSNFYGENLYLDSCGWTAWGNSPLGSPMPIQMIPSPSGIKLFGDYGVIKNSIVQRTGWDGVQAAGYNVLIESTTIDSTGIDEPGAIHQGDGIHVVRNPDIVYNINGQQIHKAGRLTVRNCYINVNDDKKSGIEAGYKDEDTEKPLLRAFDSYIAGGKGIGITQNANPINGPFYSTIENCTIANLDITRYPLRIEVWDSGTAGKIKSNIFLCQGNYSKNCPVGECNTLPNAVTYENNRWKKGDDWQLIFCSETISNCILEED